MGSKSREVLFGGDIRWAAERAQEARQKADVLACDAWTKRMLGYGGPAQPSPTLGDALNAKMRFLEVKCLGCETHSTVDLTIVRRPKETPIHELERWMRCKDCSKVRGYIDLLALSLWLRNTLLGSGGIIMIKIITLTAASFLVAATANAQFKKEDALYQFVCGGQSAPACVAKCLGPGGPLEVSYRDKLIVFQIKEHPRRIWLNADGLRTLVGDDYSCQFPSVPAVPTDGSAVTVPNTNLSVPQRQKTCVGNTCF